MNFSNDVTIPHPLANPIIFTEAVTNGKCLRLSTQRSDVQWHASSSKCRTPSLETAVLK